MNEKEKVTTVRLFGGIGSSVDGDRFANDLALLDKQFDTINIHINSNGGDVSQGYSIVSVILSMKAHVNIYVVGIAASMAAVIAVCGDDVFMYDYSRLMIHDPFFSGIDSKQLSDKNKVALHNVAASLKTILSRRGKDDAEISRLMSEETWFDAEQAKSSGLIDGIISTKRKNEFNGLSNNDILFRISAEYSSIVTNKQEYNKMNDLKLIIEALGLQGNATIDDIVAAIKILKQSVNPETDVDKAVKMKFVSEYEKKGLLALSFSNPVAFSSYMEERKKEVINKRTEEGDVLIRKAMLAGTINNDSQGNVKRFWLDAFANDFDATKYVLESLPSRLSISSQINSGDSGKSNWTLNDYRRNAPQELKSNPQLYQTLLEQEQTVNNNKH